MINVDQNTVTNALAFIDLFKHQECSNQGFIELKRNCRRIIGCIPFMAYYIQSSITRCRLNGKLLFNCKNEISYNKNLSLVQAGRFNLAKRAMFYGSLPTFNDKGEYHNYGNQEPMFEVCKELQTHEPLDLPSFFTLGFWEMTEELLIVSLCYEENHLAQNFGIKKPTTEFEKIIKTNYSKSDVKFIEKVWKYFSELSCKWDIASRKYYNILTAFYEAYIEYYKVAYKKDIDGIIYPSAMTKSKALNIALNPSSVDNKLKLRGVQMYSLGHRGLPHAYKPITKIEFVENDNFDFDAEFKKEYLRFNHFRY